MRFFTVILAIISFHSFAQMHHEEFQGKLFKKTGKEPFIKYQLKSTLKDGQWLFYDNNDTSLVRMEVNYLNHKKNGFERIYNNEGQLLRESYYEKGKKDSVWLEYHPNGYILSKLRYEDGVLNGLQTYYNPRGVNHHTTYEYVNGVKHGKSIEYLFDSTWKRSETTWIEGKQNGIYTEWYSNGQMQIQGQYFPTIDYDYIYTYNNRDGDWRYWDKIGVLFKTEHWNKGVLTRITEHVSPNPFIKDSLTYELISFNCFGHYCLGEDITKFNRSEEGWSKKGDSIFHRYRGDSLDFISLEPIFSDTLTVHRMFTTSPRFRTESQVGVGSTIAEIKASNENVIVINAPGDKRPYLILLDYNITLILDDDTNLLFRYGDDSLTIESMRSDGFVVAMEIEK